MLAGHLIYKPSLSSPHHLVYPLNTSCVTHREVQAFFIVHASFEIGLVGIFNVFLRIGFRFFWAIDQRKYDTRL